MASRAPTVFALKRKVTHAEPQHAPSRAKSSFATKLRSDATTARVSMPPMLRRSYLLALLIYTQSASCWCCRSCGKCMCEVYGVCPVPDKTEPPPTKSLQDLSADEVATFIASLGPNGSRQTCPAACPLIEQMALLSNKIRERSIHGHELLKLVHAHSHPAWVHNATLRSNHAEYLIATLGVFDKNGPKAGEKSISVMTRLRDAFKHAGYATSHDGQGGGGGGEKRLMKMARRAQQRQRREK